MANEQQGTGDFHSEKFLQLSVEGGSNEGTSLESAHSGESESVSSAAVTQIENVSSLPSSSGQHVVSISSCANNETTKENQSEETTGGDQSHSSTQGASYSREPVHTSSTTIFVNEEDTVEEASAQRKSTSDSYEGEEDGEEEGEGEEEDKDEEPSYEDDTISSEAVVDDIELILMPESVQDFSSPHDLSPQLVRVTELKRNVVGDYDADVFEDDETDQESDFKKFGTDDEASERSVSSRSHKLLRRKVLLSSASAVLGGGGGDGSENKGMLGTKIDSGVQTEITALETMSSSSFEVRRRSSGKSSFKGAGSGLSVPGKRLNWKSELTLFPSKTKSRPSGYDPMTYQDQYSPRVAMFTSQETLNSNSHFLKPSTLYRTRNLSRNLNQCETSDSTLMLPEAGPSTSTTTLDSRRYYRDRISSSTSSNFKEPHTSYRMNPSSSVSTRRQPLVADHSVGFRTSLPDLTSSPRGFKDGRGQRRSFKTKYQKSSSGQKLTRKSSSDDETSSLIDESERCLRSSIDLLLTEDFPSSHADLSCRSTGFGISSHGYYSARKSHSQPLLGDDASYEDIRSNSMGSPFLPRKLCDMRCSKWAKVILPNGQVAVVAVKEMDELRDTLTVHTDTGCAVNLPFRKVVFAWKMKR